MHCRTLETHRVQAFYEIGLNALELTVDKHISVYIYICIYTYIYIYIQKGWLCVCVLPLALGSG